MAGKTGYAPRNAKDLERISKEHGDLRVIAQLGEQDKKSSASR